MLPSITFLEYLLDMNANASAVVVFRGEVHPELSHRSLVGYR
jgi:hypothetical protein